MTNRKAVRRYLPVAVALLSLGLVPSTSAQEFAAECRPADGPIEVKIGELECQRMHSAALGGITAFTYYVPPGCAGRTCPVLFVMHGTSCSYGCTLGNVGAAADQFGDQPWRYAWIRALTSGPPVDPWTVADPWNHYDVTQWVPKSPIDMVLVAPHNRTVPGGYGPAAWTDGGWADWNPKYAAGGESQVYDTPPPLFDTHVVHELIPWLETNLPVGRGREYRAITGNSQGGLGALLIPLQHPDAFATLIALSGASIPLGYVPAAAAIRDVAPGVGAPAPLPYAPLPGPTAAAYPRDATVDPSGFVTALRGWFVGFGDPVVDETYWRGNTSQDLAMNARGWAGGVQSLPIDLYNGDALSHTYSPGSLPGALQCIGCGLPIDYLEVFANYIQAVQRIAFDAEEVAYTYRQRPGGHGGPLAYYRYFLERIYDRVRHADGGGSPTPPADRFDYRTIRKDFSLWGWHFAVERESVEFLTLTDVTCDGLTLRGSGVVTVTVPAACGTGKEGSGTFQVNLGPSMPADEHAMASYPGVYGHVLHVDLEPL